MRDSPVRVVSVLVAAIGWKRFGSLLPDAARSALVDHSQNTTAPPTAGPGGGAVGLTSVNAEAATRYEPKPYVSSPPKSLLTRMTSPSYSPRQATLGHATRPRASEPKRAGSVRRWVSATLDFDPSVSPKGEASGDEAGCESTAPDKARPRQVRVPESNANRSRPDGSNSVSATVLPFEGATHRRTHNPSHPAADRELAPESLAARVRAVGDLAAGPRAIVLACPPRSTHFTMRCLASDLRRKAPHTSGLPRSCLRPLAGRT